MKTATVTWITYNNYGTLLQAYALQKYVEMLGYENEILSDDVILKKYKESRPKENKKSASAQRETMSKSRLKSLISNPRRLRRVIAAHLDRETYQFPYYAVQKACEAFKKDEIKIREGVSSENLAILNNDYDAFICGSDQVWSVFEEIFNPYYYLDFATKKKIAYGPSLGTNIVSGSASEKIRNLLKDFAAISVRESISAKQLAEITGQNVEWVCDPTILQDREFWSEFAENARIPKDKYLLCYFLGNKPWYFDYAKKIAKKLHLKIKLVPQKWDYLSSENVIQYAVGPKEFVALFKNADYVLTDSYHGSIFSMMFERDFLYLKRFADDDTNSQNIRIDSLFGYLGVEDRIVDGENIRFDELEINNYERITGVINEFRDKSREYLKKALE